MSDHAERDGRDLSEYGQMRARVAALESELNKAKTQLPEGMEHCTILFKECSLGHASLTATNWIQRDCQSCRIATLEAELKVAGELLQDSYNAQHVGETLLAAAQQQIQERDARVAELESGKAFQQQLAIEVELRYEMEALKIEIASLKASASSALGKQDAMQAEISRLKAELEEANSALFVVGRFKDDLNAKCASQEFDIQQLERELSGAKAEIHKWKLACCDRGDNEAKIQERHDKAVDIHQNQIEARDARLAASEREAGRLREAIVRVGMARNEFLRGYNCPFCGENGSQYSVPHKADCVLVIAKAALKLKGD